MLARKITTGFVIQIFDTVKKKWISQEFFAGDDCEYEDVNGFTLNPNPIEDEYLPFEMKQPTKRGKSK